MDKGRAQDSPVRHLVVGGLVMPTKKELIRVALEKRFPCGVATPAAWTIIAEEFDCSRELVRQVAVSSGIASVGTTNRNSAPKKLCAVCGKALWPTNSGATCAPCRWVELPCAACGLPVRRRASDIAYRFSDAGRDKWGERSERVFCNRRCFGVYHAKHFGWGSDYQKERREEALK